MPIYGRTCYSHPSYIYHEALGCVYMWRLHALRREVRSARARSAELEAQMADPALPLALALPLPLRLALPLALPLALALALPLALRLALRLALALALTLTLTLTRRS